MLVLGFIKMAINTDVQVDIVITPKIAEVILDMAGICRSEGIGPDNDGFLLDLIKENFPDLSERYSWLWSSNLW